MKAVIQKSIGIAAIMVLVLFSLSGCRDKAEIGDLAVVLGTVLEKNEIGGLRVSIELAHKDSIDSEDESIVISVDADNWPDAEDKLAEELNKELYWGHMVLLILGEGFSSESVAQYLEMFYQDSRLSPIIFVAITSVSSQKIFGAKFGESAYVSKGIAERLALEMKNDPELFLTVEKCMQGIYYHQNDFEMAYLSVEDEKVRFSYMVKFHEF